MEFKRTTYGDTLLPVWADVLGWGITICCIIPIPILALMTWFDNMADNVSPLQVNYCAHNVPRNLLTGHPSPNYPLISGTEDFCDADSRVEASRRQGGGGLQQV